MQEIFKTYDIRGIYGKEITEDDAYKIGRAFVSFLGIKNPRIVLGRDGRSSSPSLFVALKKGVVDSGGYVTDACLSNTPLLGFAVAKFNYDGGAMVTASHNPKEFNGIKLDKKNALRIYGEELQEIKKIVLKGDFLEVEGVEEKRCFRMDYLNYIFSLVGDIKDLKVVIDCGNGVAAVTAKPLFEKLSSEAVFLYEEVDGSFPNHPPDPHSKGVIEGVGSKVIETGADLGAVFDGDADRCILLDEKGDLIETDVLLSLLATEELKKHPGEDIYYDLRFSMATEEDIRKAGGKPVMMRVGNPFYKEKIIKDGGLLGAELTGHVMFRENFGLDDGLFLLLKTMKVLKEKGKPMSELLSPFKRYFQTEEINLSVENKEEVLEKVKNAFKDGESVDLDGVYVKYNDWWFNLRKSNTEDLVRLRIEAKTKEILEEKRKEITELIS